MCATFLLKGASVLKEIALPKYGEPLEREREEKALRYHSLTRLLPLCQDGVTWG